MGQPTPPVQPDPRAICQPRPVPVLWTLNVVRTDADDGTSKHLVRNILTSWNGDHVTFWGRRQLDAYIKDLRSALRVMTERESGLAAPAAPSLILPPGIGE